MPSELIEPQGLSSPTFFSDNTSFPTERQVGFWRSDAMPDNDAIGKSVALTAIEKILAAEHQSVKSLEHSQSFLMQGQKMYHSLDMHAVGAERAVSPSLTLLRPVDHDPGMRPGLNAKLASSIAEGDKVNMMTTQYENSLFSSSLSELFNRKLRLISNNAQYGHSVDIVASHLEEEEPIESLEEIEAQTIGNLLPSDDDLFTGVTDRVDNINQPSCGDDIEELDFFSSVGGMDLGDDGSAAQSDSEFPGRVSNGQLGACHGPISGEHPYGEHPSRTLFVRNINSSVEDAKLKELFEIFGAIRTLYTACKHRGFVMVSYYDIRSATEAMKTLQNTPLNHRKLDIHYSIPKENPSEKDINQGTLAVFNLDSSVSNDRVHKIFGVYGAIKEIRESSHKSHHRFVEYYDVRAAEVALHKLNGIDIDGKWIKVEPSHLGASRWCLLQQIPPYLEQDEHGPYMQRSISRDNSTTGFSGAVHCGAIISSSMDDGNILGLPSAIKGQYLKSPSHHGISCSVPDNLPSHQRVESAGNQAGLAEASQSHGQLKADIHPHSLPECHDDLKGAVHCHSAGTLATNINVKPLERIDHRLLYKGSTNGHLMEFNNGVPGSAGNGSCSVLGRNHTWGSSYQTQPSGVMWPNSPSFVNGFTVVQPTSQLHGPSRGPPPVLNQVLPSLNNHHVGSASHVNPSFWNRRNAFAGESPEISGFHPVSFGSTRISNNSLHTVDFVSNNIFPQVGGNCLDLRIPPKSIGLQSNQQRFTMFPGRGHMIPTRNSFDPPSERARSRRNEGSINQADKKQYELDIDRILQGEDNRTTLMIKNIPNKYTSKMLLATIDECHKGTYDFIYLPIDFKNKCNVGYAFINMIDSSHIIPFYEAFNGKKWEKFNSEKVASLAYARIQGKAALIAHFQNSSLMNEDKRCRPILFSTDGPNAGDQVPFPMGVNVRTRAGKPQAIAHEENQEGNPPNLAKGLRSMIEGTSSGKESD